MARNHLSWLMAAIIAVFSTAALAGTSNNLWLWSTTAGSNTTADAGINWSEGQAPSTINDSARGMMAALARWRSDLGAITTAGTANAQTLTTNSGLTALATGNTVIFKVGSGLTNSAAATLNVDGLGAKSVRQFTAGGEVALSGGELQAGQRYLATYDTALNGGSGAWIVLNPTPASGAGYASTSTTITGTGYVTGGGNLGANRTLSLGTMGAASRLMGSASTSSTITDISIGSGLTLSGTTLSATAATAAPTVTVYTSGSGTHTPGGSTRWMRVRVVAGGGAGGGAPATSSGQASVGSGGSAGGYVEHVYTSSPGALSYSVGGGGTAVSGGTGGNGSNSTFGTLTATAGNGGTTAGPGTNAAVNAPGTSASSGGNVLVVSGTPGGASFYSQTASAYLIGNGGAGPWGGGGLAPAPGNSGNSGIANTGGGGSGTGNGSSAAARTGGNGGSGVIIVEEYQ